MPRPTLITLKQSTSSGRWLQRQVNDPFVRARAGGEGKDGDTLYRSRASFKLVSMAKKYPSLLPKAGLVIDLGAAPGESDAFRGQLRVCGRAHHVLRSRSNLGGWSQVASPKVGSKGRVVALDLLPILPIARNVTVLQGDFLSPSVQAELEHVIATSAALRHKQGAILPDNPETEPSSGAAGSRVDTILSDMMANMSGIRVRDIEASLELCQTALSFARGRLKTGLTKRAEADGEEKRALSIKDYKGCMLIKFFQHPLLSEFKKKQLQPVFEKVLVEKPKESRSESSEAYFVCLGYKGE
ncbi:hypothetical protein QFC22_005758 [Naganishia vaughanmartiniae]|uniref:Uncharacterized protein n=1 Tax=Naganishia vaughanmartiniae TaxID=1424756 RepID=A0ACC2WSB8_9TREE|nr:hypothetical protein QFC22_005758 [Naganishia vaughanmartiniae]